jgi:hypothetical protein
MTFIENSLTEKKGQNFSDLAHRRRVTREMDTLLDLIRHFLAFELMRTSLSLPLIYKTSMKEVRWRAVSPDTFMAMLKIEGNFSCLRARLAHFVGHLPPTPG